MALARTASRLIVVDDERYRWTVAAGDDEGMAIVVEWADGDGQRMATWVEHGNVIAPGLVARVIRWALAGGWTPRHRAREVMLRLDDSELAALLGQARSIRC